MSLKPKPRGVTMLSAEERSVSRRTLKPTNFLSKPAKPEGQTALPRSLMTADPIHWILRRLHCGDPVSLLRQLQVTF